MPELQIYEAASVGHLEAVVERLSIGDNVDKATQFGHTSLINASLNNHAEVVKVLLSAGAKINLMDVNRETALIAAASNGNRDIVKILLEYGADIMHRNSQGKTAKEMAKRNNHLMSYQHLVEAERSGNTDNKRDTLSSTFQRPITPKTSTKLTSIGKSMFEDKLSSKTGSGKSMFEEKTPSKTGSAVNIREELHKIRYNVKGKKDSQAQQFSTHATGQKLEAVPGSPPMAPKQGWDASSSRHRSSVALESASAATDGETLLNRHLALRPTKGDLIGRGLMFGSLESLNRRGEDIKAKRSQLENRLMSKLSERPKKEVLKVKGILKKSKNAKDDVKGLLNRKLDQNNRPTKQELQDRNIIKNANVSPLLVATEEMLKKRQLEQALEKKLEKRHKHNEVLRQSVLLKNQLDLEVKSEEESSKKKSGRASILSQITSKMTRRSNSTSSITSEGTPSGSPKTRPKLDTKLSFHGEVLVARTYDSDDYDRSPATKRKYTPNERLGIAKELNQFKMYEMAVHDDSKDHIHFIRTPLGL